jgi:hypothetical protein
LEFLKPFFKKVLSRRRQNFFQKVSSSILSHTLGVTHGIFKLIFRACVFGVVLRHVRLYAKHAFKKYSSARIVPHFLFVGRRGLFAHFVLYDAHMLFWRAHH